MSTIRATTTRAARRKRLRSSHGLGGAALFLTREVVLLLVGLWVVGCCRFGYPLMLKAKTMAYDGKGNAVAKTEADVKDAFELLGACRQAGRGG